MKIAAVLDNSVTVGGGFNQALNAIRQMARLAQGNFEFTVFTCIAANIDYFNKLGIPVKIFNCGWKDRLLNILLIDQIGHRVQDRLKLISNFEQNLIDNAVHLVYFVSPTPRALSLQKLNYISTVWDLSHRDTPEFPEVREFNNFHYREWLYKNSLPPALFVMTDSDVLSERISKRYGVDHERLLTMPFSPSPFTSEEHSHNKIDILRKYKLVEGYYFYPAQFWAHKNHIRLLEALLKLKRNGVRLELVFSGGDQGSRSHVEGYIARHSLEDQVKILGFVPAENMRGLYDGCQAVVIPTYFGPTNLPPLEAWMIGKPLIYSSHFKEQVGDAALCINPDVADELAEAMLDCNSPATRARLVAFGTCRLQEIEQQRSKAEANLLERIKQFEARLRCWH